jgi:type IV pilus assembly protein PilM
MKKYLDLYFKFIRKLLSGKKSASSVGLDIGTSECKLVELSKTEKGFEILNLMTEPIVNGDIQNSVQKILAQQNIGTKSCYSAVLGKGTLIRYIDMPRMNIDELKKAFGIESDKYFPFGQEKIYTDCFIIDQKHKNNQMLVLAAAAKKELIDQRVKLLSTLGIQTNFIGLNSIAVANVIHVLGYGVETPANTAVAVLDMGDSVTHLMILVDQLPRFNRDIFIGGRDFTRMISNSLGVSLQEAENLKINAGDKKAQVMEACESVIVNLIQELRLSLDFFTSEHNREIKHILLTGGASLLDGISDLFNKNLEINATLWDPFKLTKLSPTLKLQDTKGQFSKYTVALGLALYDYD